MMQATEGGKGTKGKRMLFTIDVFIPVSSAYLKDPAQGSGTYGSHTKYSPCQPEKKMVPQSKTSMLGVEGALNHTSSLH